jgi:hypothetical protein
MIRHPQNRPSFRLPLPHPSRPSRSASKNTSGILLELLLPFWQQSLSQKRSRLQRHRKCNRSNERIQNSHAAIFSTLKKITGFSPKKYPGEIFSEISLKKNPKNISRLSGRFCITGSPGRSLRCPTGHQTWNRRRVRRTLRRGMPLSDVRPHSLRRVTICDRSSDLEQEKSPQDSST